MGRVPEREEDGQRTPRPLLPCIFLILILPPLSLSATIAHPRRHPAPSFAPPRPARGTHAPPLASFFGVGAPEALLVGVVALLVFGPKGLAEAVKSVGKTLRAFQPTIRELASVSSELRNTLEEQIGLDEIRAELKSAVAPLPATTPVKKGAAAVGTEVVGGEASSAFSAAAAPESSLSEAVAAMQGGEASTVDPIIDAKRAAAAAAAWGGVLPAAAVEVPGNDADGDDDSLLGDVPLDALEAELARRRGQA